MRNKCKPALKYNKKKRPTFYPQKKLSSSKQLSFFKDNIPIGIETQEVIFHA